MTEIDMARQHGHNMEVEFVDNKDAFNIGYKSFLAGLKAGKLKWHKVADGDLPKKDDWYLCKSKMWIGKIFTILLRYSDECFYDEKEIPFNGDVIAWCEIPKYTEVEK